MESKKLPFSEHFQWSRRKVVSGFGLGVATSLIVLTVLLLSNNSLKGGFLFQGLNNVGVNSSISWPFHFSSTNSSGKNNDLMQRIEEEKDKNGNFSVEDGRFEEKSNEGNGSVVTKNGNLLGSNEEETVLENTHLGNFSENVKNGSYLSEEGRDFGNGNFSISAKDDVNEENKTVEGKSVEDSRSENLSDNGENGRFFPGDGKDSSEKNKIEISNYDSNYEKCDIYDGKWVRDDSKPYYPPGSCPYIGRDFDCHLNGRPDDGFLKWKWQPNGCNIPSMNATDFLERLRGQKMVFVGDSLNRNMWESLVCILRHSITNKKKVYEISGRTEFKKKGFYAFRFEDYNCTVDFVSSPFLVRESSFNGRNGSFETLRLDLMDRTTSMYHDADIMIFNTGHWWTHEKTSRGEDYYQEGNYVHPKLKVLEAYKKALTTWGRWVDKNIDSKRTQVFFRGYSVTHFRGGQWNSGGQCHKETEPIFNTTYLAKYPSKMRALEPVLQKLKTPVIYLNISRLTDFRKDGHPSIYRMKNKTAAERIAAERSQDCSHWCLPGVPDTWNELLYASLLKTGRGSWRR